MQFIILLDLGQSGAECSSSWKDASDNSTNTEGVAFRPRKHRGVPVPAEDSVQQKQPDQEPSLTPSFPL